jgi:drug/metabolite transporter (DMT)-like permease
MKSYTKAYLAVIAANLIFAINYSVVKYVTPQFIHPFSLNVVRILVSILFFWILYLLKPSKASIQKKHIPRFIACAITGSTINQLFFIKGVSLTTPIHSSLLSLSTPIFISIIAAWLIKEGLNLLKILGLAFGVGGALMLVLLKDNNHTGSNVLLGDIMVLVNAVSYAFYLVLVRPLMASYSPVHVLRWVFTFGSLFIIPFGITEFLATNFAVLNLAQWIAIGFISVGATCLAYLFNVYGISIIGSSATGSFIYTQPLFTAAIAIVFTGEHFSWIKAVATILIFTGVYLANFKKTVPMNRLAD